MSPRVTSLSDSGFRNQLTGERLLKAANVCTTDSKIVHTARKQHVSQVTGLAGDVVTPQWQRMIGRSERGAGCLIIIVSALGPREMSADETNDATCIGIRENAIASSATPSRYWLLDAQPDHYVARTFSRTSILGSASHRSRERRLQSRRFERPHRIPARHASPHATCAPDVPAAMGTTLRFRAAASICSSATVPLKGNRSSHCPDQPSCGLDAVEQRPRDRRPV